MADIIDDANDAADLLLKSALSQQLRKSTRVPTGTGRCLNCGVKVKDKRRWCGTDCRDVWEKDNCE